MLSKLKQNKLIMRIQVMLMIFVLGFLSNIAPVVPAFAATVHTYYIQTAIDTSNWSIVAGVVNDKDGLVGNYTEVERIGSDALKDLKTDAPSTMFSSMMGEGESLPTTEGGGDKNNKVLSFPGYATKDGIFTPQASAQDMDRATFIKDSLVYDFNMAVKLAFGDSSGKLTFSNITEYRNQVSSLLSAVQGNQEINGWKFTRSPEGVEVDPDNGIERDCYVSMKKGSEEYIFLTSIIKYPESMNVSDEDKANDTKYITWGTLFYEALVNSTLDKDAVTADTVYNPTSQGVLEGAVTSLMSSLVDGVRSVLGLWDLDSLIFNTGVRGSSGYVFGIFPSTWETYIWTFFFISEILSIAIIMFAIIKNVLERAMATVNPVVRANAMEQIKDMGIAIMVLVMLPMIIIGMMQLSSSLTNIFTTMLDGRSVTDEIGHFSTGSSLAGIVVGIANLIINIYFNWFYIIRSITVAVLICLSPIFVTMFCLGQEKKRLAMNGIMELVANVFIQPIHAMLMTLIIFLPHTGRPIESLILLYCMIPLTALLKGLFFPGTSDAAHRTSLGAGLGSALLAKKGAGMLVGATAGGIRGALTAHHDKKNAEEEEKARQSNAGGNNNIQNKNVDTTAAKSEKKDSKQEELAKAKAGAGDVSDEKQEDSATKTNDLGQDKVLDAFNTRTSAENLAKDIDNDTPQKDAAIDPNAEKHPIQQAGSDLLDGLKNTPKKMAEEIRGSHQDDDSTPQAAQMKARNKINWATGKLIAAAAITGAANGWRGQLFADVTRSTMGLNARQDIRRGYRNLSQAQAQEAEATQTQQQKTFAEQSDSSRTQTFANRYDDYEPNSSLEQNYTGDPNNFGGTQIGDESVYTPEELDALGISNMHRTSDGDLRYTADLDRVSQDTRQNLLDACATDEGRALAEQQGYRVMPHMKDGLPTGKMDVIVGKNGVTGQMSPAIDRNTQEVSVGGERQSLVPNMHTLKENQQAVESYNQHVKNQEAYEGQLNKYNQEMQQAMTPINQTEQNTIGDLNKRAYALNNSNEAASQAVRTMRNDGIKGGSAVRFAAASGAAIQRLDDSNYQAVVSPETMQNNGISNLKISDSGRQVQYEVQPNTTNSELAPVLAERQAARHADKQLVSKGQNPHYLNDIDHEYAKNGTTFTDKTDGSVIIQRTLPDSNKGSFGTVNSNNEFVVTNRNTSIAPKPVELEQVGGPKANTIGSKSFFGPDQSKIIQQEKRSIHNNFDVQRKQARQDYMQKQEAPTAPVMTESAQKGQQFVEKIEKQAAHRKKDSNMNFN